LLLAPELEPLPRPPLLLLFELFEQAASPAIATAAIAVVRSTDALRTHVLLGLMSLAGPGAETAAGRTVTGT
jgi:hypothetical protein